MASYYKRLQTVISYGEEDLYHFVESQNMKNSLYIKKLIREEMIRQAGKGVLNTPVQSAPKQYKEPVQEDKAPEEEVTKQEQNPPVDSQQVDDTPVTASQVEETPDTPQHVETTPAVNKEDDKKPAKPIRLDGGGHVF